MSDTFTCADCGRTLPVKHTGGTGYATLPDERRVCYTCAGVRDYAELVDPSAKKAYGYLSGGVFSNWCGTLRAQVSASRGRHNIAGVRRDFWLRAVDRDGHSHYWHGVNYGNYSEIAHLYRVIRPIPGALVTVLDYNYADAS